MIRTDPPLATVRGDRYKQSVSDASIVIVRERRIDPAELRRLVLLYFEDMVKYVVDVSRGAIAVGGEMHADAEAVLLEDGSRQDDLWGANYYPGRGRDGCIEYTSLINISPPGATAAWSCRTRCCATAYAT